VIGLGAQVMKMPVSPPNFDDPRYLSVPHHVEMFSRYDKPLLEELYSWIREEESELIFYTQVVKTYGSSATYLIQLIQEEYSLAEL